MEKINIGDGQRKLAVIAGNKIPDSELVELITGTLSIVPLNEQFGEVTFYRTPADRGEEEFIEEISRNLWGKGTIIAVITPSWLKRGKEECGVAYSSRHRVVLAHELGHALWLTHPEGCRKIQKLCPASVPRCGEARYIMGCPEDNDPLEFSPSDIEVLRRGYKAIYGEAGR